MGFFRYLCFYSASNNARVVEAMSKGSPGSTFLEVANTLSFKKPTPENKVHIDSGIVGITLAYCSAQGLG